MGRCIEIWTDGGSRPTSGSRPGAYAFIAAERGKVLYEESGLIVGKTHNEMELTAAIKAIEWCIKENLQDEIVFIYTDSQYVQQGITKWIDKWKQRKWKTTNRKEVANKDLWIKLDEQKGKLSRLNFNWIRGHIGVPNNVRADELCSKELDKYVKDISKNDK